MTDGLASLHLEPSVLKAIEKYDLREKAYGRADLGSCWLDANVPGWRLQMISIVGGRVVSHVRLAFNTQNPLALALRTDPAVLGPDGRPDYGKVWTRYQELDKLRRYASAPAADFGFTETSHLCGNVLVTEQIDGYLLDEAWERVLRNLEWHEVPRVQRAVA